MSRASPAGGPGGAAADILTERTRGRGEAVDRGRDAGSPVSPSAAAAPTGERLLDSQGSGPDRAGGREARGSGPSATAPTDAEADRSGRGVTPATDRPATGRTPAPPAGRTPPAVPLLAGLGAVLLASLLLAIGLRARHRRAAGTRHPGRRRAGWRLREGSDRRVGGYEVLEEIGRGGMATTYRARRLADGRQVALKIPHETGDPSYLERFVREGKLGETLHHPGIVAIHEAGEDGGLAFLAMELLPGTTLRQEIERHPRGLGVEPALAIALQIAEALDYAHAKGVVHRDLKPENVMLLPDGGLKVMDFGVARIEGQPGLTTSQVFFGSPVYAAPELVEPGAISPCSDLYSLGIVLFELIEGRPPFVHESVFKLLEMHQQRPLPDPGTLERPVPPELWRVIERLCAKLPEERYPSAERLLIDLRRLLYRAAGSAAPGGGRLAEGATG